MTNDTHSIEELIDSADQALDKDSPGALFAEKQQQIKVKDLERLAVSRAQSTGVPYIDLSSFPIGQEAIGLIEEEEAKRTGVVCFFFDGKNLRLAALDPFNQEVRAKLQELKAKYFVSSGEVYLVSRHSLDKALWHYKSVPKIKAAPAKVQITAQDLEKFKEEISDFKSLNEKINKVNMSDMLVLIIAAAIKVGSSDVHIEAEENGVAVRLRVDGTLQEAATIGKEKWKQVTARLKILSKVKINIENKPQDGRFTIKANDEDLVVRSSFLPTAYGESVVMRLLRLGAVSLPFNDLGLSERDQKILAEEIVKPNGMILVTGPTGSGKTTTLYSVLNQLNKPGTKIITLEDPIEYQLEGINQSQVEEEKGYTFSIGLRSVLRQDPDIVMVGEMRDIETAEIAVRAALTGHLVLSTLHTNDAAGVIPRLLDLGVHSYLLSPSINAIVGQRLVRRLCPHCKKKQALLPDEEAKLKKILAVISPKAGVDIPKDLSEIYKSVGCEKCNGLGYKGRVGIYEILTIDEKIKKLTADNAPAFKILEQAIENGMTTMLQDGVLKCLKGMTSLEEVYEVAGKMDYIEALYEVVVSQTIGRGIRITEEEMLVGKKIAANLSQDNATLITDLHTDRIAALIMAGAIKAEAGDVHIDPTEGGATIRYRVDGILQDIAKLGKDHYIALIGNIKNTAGLETHVHKPTFDGRFALYPPNEKMDCRISIISGGYGETAVIRLLARQAQSLELEELGMTSVSLKMVLGAVKKTKGIIITTGPTGSGKTTTLYSLINKLNKPDVKIITLEDPIEYNMPGIIQTQINTEEGYTFAAALRSLMRQNPNIIMIGEIRDDETAEIAIEAALTGHLVLSTIHANSAAGAISRFVGLGITKNLLSSSIECSIGQRLVRKLCPHCKKEVKVTEEERARIKEEMNKITPETGLSLKEDTIFYGPGSCEQCGHIGYKGRVGIYEVIKMSPGMQRLIQDNNMTEAEIEKLALEEGSILMIHDGLIKAAAGETSLEEVFRVSS